jgi:serine/threonine protein kinase
MANLSLLPAVASLALLDKTTSAVFDIVDGPQGDRGAYPRLNAHILRPHAAHGAEVEHVPILPIRPPGTKTLRHDYVVSIHAVVQPEEGIPYLVMEQLAGPTLADLLQRKGLTPEQAAEITIQTAEGLAAAHAAGLVHRDVKPGNIMFDGEGGRAKIMDFGLARWEDAPSGLPQEGAVVGTPDYMSPEQAGAKPLDVRTDIYSLGVTLYEMLTGALPFRGTPHIARQAADFSGASAWFRKSLPLREKAVTLQPQEKMAHRDVYLAWNALGQTYLFQGDFLRAREHFEKGLALTHRLADTEPTNKQFLADLHTEVVRYLAKLPAGSDHWLHSYGIAATYALCSAHAGNSSLQDEYLRLAREALQKAQRQNSYLLQGWKNEPDLAALKR